MRISALAEATGIPLASVKFYIREGMLPKGIPTSATSAEYSEEHVKRIRLIQALSDVRSLPLAQVKEILRLVDEPLDSPSETLSRSIAALPPYVADAEEYPRAHAVISALDLAYSDKSVAIKQLESAIQAVLDAGLEWTDEDVQFYGRLAMETARREIEPMMSLPHEEVIQFAVLGTAMFEPIILALRRLAHVSITIRLTEAMLNGVRPEGWVGPPPPGWAPNGAHPDSPRADSAAEADAAHEADAADQADQADQAD